jgi:hypothetical protein
MEFLDEQKKMQGALMKKQQRSQQELLDNNKIKIIEEEEARQIESLETAISKIFSAMKSFLPFVGNNAEDDTSSSNHITATTENKKQSVDRWQRRLQRRIDKKKTMTQKWISVVSSLPCRTMSSIVLKILLRQ